MQAGIPNWRRWLAVGGLALGVWAQNGDKAGEVQPVRVAAERIPPAPVLPPEAQLRTFRVPPGFRVEVVAAEPLVRTPVAVQFDERGRLWVVEMTGYMRNVEGTAEREPVGNVVVLEDADGDGRMDRRTVFLDGLVMPRAVMLYRDGALVAEPPRLWFARDTDGDGRADERTLVADDYAPQDDAKLGDKANPEHASNSPLWARDNWIYSANHTVRFRNTDGAWRREETIFRGQWGLTQDDFGRLFYNSNSDQLRADLIPSAYLARQPHLRPAYGANVQVARDQRVWPARVNPGVNRGYQPNQLTAEGRLATYTGACGPVIYRGDQFPEEFRGDAFLCEPTGNLIRRNKLAEQDGVITATNAHPEAEFLTSTDERFRPVNLVNGPDGCLYVVDIARGLIQHRIYLTSYLRQQIESRGLQAPVDLGRIYRIVHTGKPRGAERLGARPATAELLAKLNHPNGWWRDRAQQLLVERRDPAAGPALQAAASSAANPNALGRLHALWTLEGLGQVSLATLEPALQDAHPQVRIAGLRLLEGFFAGPQRNEALDLLWRRAGFLPGAEQVQLLLTLGQARSPQADAIARVLLMNGPATPLRFDAVLSGLAGREVEFLDALLSDPLCGDSSDAHAPFVRGVARCVALEGKPARLEPLLELAARRQVGEWQQLAILDGLLGTLPAPAKGQPAPAVKPVRFNAEPKGWGALRLMELDEVRGRVTRLAPLFTWPGDGAASATVAARPLTAAEQESLTRGKEMYTLVCGACHQPHGNGQEGLAPPLRDSEWALGSEQRLIRMVLHGVRDAITVKGQKWELNMPAFGEALDDQQIADALTFLRREWGHTADPVAEATVKAVRAATSAREDSWTEAELLKIP
jgi:mono/diheme cytochrome c family protein/glucose/arabinose dehydrogenase